MYNMKFTRYNNNNNNDNDDDAFGRFVVLAVF
jgi:hypothetical protein